MMITAQSKLLSKISVVPGQCIRPALASPKVEDSPKNKKKKKEKGNEAPHTIFYHLPLKLLNYIK